MKEREEEKAKEREETKAEERKEEKTKELDELGSPHVDNGLRVSTKCQHLTGHTAANCPIKMADGNSERGSGSSENQDIGS